MSAGVVDPTTAPVARWRVAAWAAWDWGSSAWNAVIVSFVFGPYVVRGVVGDEPLGHDDEAAPAPAVERVQRERDPDQREPDKAGRAERLAEEPDAEQELDRRAQVLEQRERRHRQLARGEREQQDAGLEGNPQARLPTRTRCHTAAAGGRARCATRPAAPRRG